MAFCGYVFSTGFGVPCHVLANDLDKDQGHSSFTGEGQRSQ